MLMGITECGFQSRETDALLVQDKIVNTVYQLHRF